MVVAGFDYVDEGEYIPTPVTDRREWGGDRKWLALKPDDQARILAVVAENPKTIVILLGGAAITVEEWQQAVGAILMAFYPGEEGGAALARILLGDVNPSGKLPFTVPRSASDLPPFDNLSKTVEYGYYNGYMLVDREGFEPRYPFGYGLSYTTFEYGDPVLDTRLSGKDAVVHAFVDVTNTGKRAGEEVVELYVGAPASKVDRPVRVLRGFEKVAVAPGETRRVMFSLKASDLATFDLSERRWTVEPTEYQVYVAGSSRAPGLRSAAFRIVD